MAVVSKKVAKKSAARKKSAPKRKHVAPRQSAAAKPGATVQTAQPAIFYRLHALLHTVQTIAQYEDQLCSLANHARSAGTLDADAQEELHTLLLDLPSSAYHAELDALHEALHGMSENAADTRSGARRGTSAELVNA